jgi:hypothetical protein
MSKRIAELELELSKSKVIAEREAEIKELRERFLHQVIFLVESVL